MWAASSLQTVQKFWEDRVEGPQAGLGRSWVGAWIHLLRHPPYLLRHPPLLSSEARWHPAHQGAWRKCRHQVAVLGLRRVVAVGQRREGLKAALSPGAGWGLRAPLLFIFTQNVPGFFCVPQRALSILLLQPLPVLKKLKRKANVTYTPACM